MIRDGDCDFVLAGGADTPILPELIHGFANMNATIKVNPKDRAYENPAKASRPFSVDRKGFVLSEGAGVVVLAADEAIKAYGLKPRAEVLGIGGHQTLITIPVQTCRPSSALSGKLLMMQD